VRKEFAITHNITGLAGLHAWSGLQKLGVEEKEYIAFGNDANDITMFQHAMYSVMIGESLQLAPFTSEQLVLSKDTEKHSSAKT
jgi:hypothetical protein